MKYTKEQYQDYFHYLLGFKTPAISVGNTIMQDGSYNSIFYGTNPREFTNTIETKLISELMDEHEDIKEFNEDIEVLTVHSFIISTLRRERLSKILT
jgi:hypothetical protein